MNSNSPGNCRHGGAQPYLKRAQEKATATAAAAAEAGGGGMGVCGGGGMATAHQICRYWQCLYRMIQAPPWPRPTYGFRLLVTLVSISISMSISISIFILILQD
jgi:hypothetical protein